MSLDLVLHGPAGLSAASLGMAMVHRLSAYDASYAALAMQLAAPLLTGDRKLATRARQAGVVVRLIEPS